MSIDGGSNSKNNIPNNTNEYNHTPSKSKKDTTSASKKAEKHQPYQDERRLDSLEKPSLPDTKATERSIKVVSSQDKITSSRSKEILLDNISILLKAAQNETQLKKDFPVKINYLVIKKDPVTQKTTETRYQLLPYNADSPQLSSTETSKLYPSLIKALKKYQQENQREIEKLKQKIDVLEKNISQQKKQHPTQMVNLTQTETIQLTQNNSQNNLHNDNFEAKVTYTPLHNPNTIEENLEKDAIVKLDNVQHHKTDSHKNIIAKPPKIKPSKKPPPTLAERTTSSVSAQRTTNMFTPETSKLKDNGPHPAEVDDIPQKPKVPPKPKVKPKNFAQLEELKSHKSKQKDVSEASGTKTVDLKPTKDEIEKDIIQISDLLRETSYFFNNNDIALRTLRQKLTSLKNNKGQLDTQTLDAVKTLKEEATQLLNNSINATFEFTDDLIGRLAEGSYDNTPELKNLKEKFNILFEEKQHFTNFSHSSILALLQLKDNASTYISGVAAKKLIEGNERITDLSDSQRPIKIIENYTLLYDNQYSDLLSTSKDETRCMKNIFNYMDLMSKEWSKIRESTIQTADLQKKKGALLKDKLYNIFFEKDTNNNSLKTSYINQDLVKSCFSEEIKNGHIKEVNDFVNEANRILAAMSCQNPPCVLKSPKEGTPVNKLETRATFTNGTHIEFNIWPSMYLKEGGDIIYLGFSKLYNKSKGMEKENTTTEPPKKTKMDNMTEVNATQNTQLYTFNRLDLLAKENTKKVNDTWPALEAKIPNLSLSEISPCLKAVAMANMCAQLNDKPQIFDSGEIIDPVISYFKQVRAQFSIDELLDKISKETLHEVREKIPNCVKIWANKHDIANNGFYNINSNYQTNALNLAHDSIVENISHHDNNFEHDREFSLTGHQRYQITYNDLQLMEDLGQGIKVNEMLKIEAGNIAASSDYTKLSPRLNKIDIEKLKTAIERRNAAQEALNKGEITKDHPDLKGVSQDDLNTITQAHKLFFDIKNNTGRYWSHDALCNADILDNDFRKNYKTLMAIDQVHNDQTDKSQLLWMINEHDNKTNHPNVIVEGAGPTGLLVALTQFEKGANVSLFEKRSTEYNRVQVVRLDPLWMASLKLYLGERYYDLFEGKDSYGPMCKDGFGEIAIFRLEDALHKRITELTSVVSEQRDNKIRTLKDQVNPVTLKQLMKIHHSDDSLESKIAESKRITDKETEGAQLSDLLNSLDPIERFAAYELQTLEDEPSKTDKRLFTITPSESGYRVTAKYNEKAIQRNNDSQQNPGQTPEKREDTIVQRHADMIICAGGKNSSIAQQAFKYETVTGMKDYGVATWEGRGLGGVNNEIFPDFTNVLEINDNFINLVKNNLLKVFDYDENLSFQDNQQRVSNTKHHHPLGISTAAKECLVSIWHGNKDALKQVPTNIQLQPWSKVSESLVKKRTRNKPNTVQLRTFQNKGLIYIGMEMPSNYALFVQNTDAIIDSQKISTIEKKAIKNELKKAWFQAVADHKEFNKSGKMDIGAINSDFSAIFPVSQHKLNTPVNILQKPPHKLLITAAGDAAVSPHFMRYSGLSGAREQAFELQKFTDKAFSSDESWTESEELHTLQKHMTDITEFVINRGREFFDTNSKNKAP